MNQNPRKLAHGLIDKQLKAKGQKVQSIMQVNFAACLGVAARECDKMRETITTRLQQADTLRQSVLNKALKVN